MGGSLSEHLTLDIYGLRIHLRCRDARAIEYVSSEYMFFIVGEDGTPPALRLNGFLNSDPEAPSRVSHEQSALRCVDYGERGFLAYDASAAMMHLHGDSSAALAILVNAVISSEIRRSLPDVGITAFPWMSLSVEGRALIFAMLPGGGKTTLALELLKNPAFRLLSESFTLVSRNGTLLPFPKSLHKSGEIDATIPQTAQTRIVTLRGKARVAIDIRFFEDQLSKNSQPDALFFCQRIPSGDARIEALPLGTFLGRLIRQTVTLRRIDKNAAAFIPRKELTAAERLRNAFLRLRAAQSVFRRSRIHMAYLGPDIARNTRMIEAFALEGRPD